MAKRIRKGKGWFYESRRHSLAAKGIKTKPFNINRFKAELALKKELYAKYRKNIAEQEEIDRKIKLLGYRSTVFYDTNSLDEFVKELNKDGVLTEQEIISAVAEFYNEKITPEHIRVWEG